MGFWLELLLVFVHLGEVCPLRITTIVINVGSKERDNEETTRSFDNDLSFEVDGWKEIE